MRTYNIYLDRIEISFGESFQGPSTLKEILISLSQDLYNFYLSLRLGKGITYRRMSYLIDDLVNITDFRKPVDEISIVDLLRNSLCFLRRFDFPDFQINILNHV